MPARKAIARTAEAAPKALTPEQALSRQVEDVAAIVAEAEADLAAGRQQEAMHGYRRALRIEPRHGPALARLAALVLDRGFADEADLPAAIEVCRSAIALLPHPAAAHALLGRTLLAASRSAEAVEAYRAAAALDPSNLNAFAGLALALVSDGQLKTGLEVAEEVLRLDSGLAEAWYARGRALLLLRRPTPAAHAFARAIALSPTEGRTHLGLGDALAELDLTADAIANLSRAVELSPDSKWAHANLGSVLYRSGDLHSAEAHCRRALALDPDLPIAHQNLAGILADLGDKAGSRRHRDAAFGLRNLNIERADDPRASVLVLSTCDSGNIPYRHLLPADRYTRLEWFIEYARPSQAGELPPYDVVFNIIGDPDFSSPTDAFAAEFARSCERRVLNAPERIGATRRDALPCLLADIEGLLIPKAARLDSSVAGGCDLVAWTRALGLEPPLLVRPIGSHGGQGLTLIRTREALQDLDPAGGLYATEFCDFRSADGLYRKYRTIFVDRRPYPYHLAISDHWLVHYETSDTRADPVRLREELAFLREPEASLGPTAFAAIAAIGRRLDLDYAGVDFGVLPDGRVVVFEANATMLVHPETEAALVHKNPYVERITSAFQALVEASRQSASGARPARS